MYPFFFVANRDFEKLAAIGAKQLDGAAKYPYIPYVYLVSGRIMADFFPKSDQASDDKIRAKYAATDYDKLFNMAVIDKYAQQNGFAIVLDVSSQNTPVLYASNTVDITKEVIDLYDKTVFTATPAPAAPGPAAARPAAPPAARPAPGTAAPKPAAPPAAAPAKKQ